MNMLEQYSNTSKLLSEMNLQQGSYISLLKDIEKILPTLLKKSSSWNTVDINYSSPIVNRVWLEYGALRVCLHRIYPENPSKTLFHPHPWPSSMKILKGTYEMGVGFSKNNDQPPLATTLMLSEGTYYEMIHPNGWHYVCPVESITYSLMISGRPWFDTPHIPPKDLLPLTDKIKEEILDFFRTKYN